MCMCSVITVCSSCILLSSRRRHTRCAVVPGVQTCALPILAPLRGWGPKGKRLRGFTPHGHWRTLTFLGALRYDRLTAPCVFDGPINGQCFRAYVEQQLVPVLEPGDIVVMENLGSQDRKSTRLNSSQ